MSVATAAFRPAVSVREEFRALVALSLPIAIAQLGLMGLTLVDTAIVGRESSVAFAGASLGRVVGYATSSLGMGLAMTLEPIASQAIAAGEPHVAALALRKTLHAIGWLTLPTVLAALAITSAMRFGHVAAENVHGAQMFLLGSAPGTSFFAAFLAGKTFLQAHGSVSALLRTTVLVHMLNFVLCSLLVRGDAALLAIHLPAIGLPALGALGAGIANSIASGALFLGVYLEARRMPGANQPPPVLTNNVHDARSVSHGGREPSVRRLIVQAFPVGFQLLAEVGVFSFAAFLAARFGTVVNDAHQIALSLASFTFMGALGISGATAVRVGKAVGEGRSARRAGMLGIGLGALFMVLGAFVFTTFPERLAGLFTTDPEVRVLATSLLRIAAFFQLMDGVQGVAGGALRGAGDVRFASLANLVCHWCIGLPVALWLTYAMKLGVAGLWWGLTAGIVAVAIVMSVRFYRLTGRVLERM